MEGQELPGHGDTHAPPSPPWASPADSLHLRGLRVWLAYRWPAWTLTYPRREPPAHPPPDPHPTPLFPTALGTIPGAGHRSLCPHPPRAGEGRALEILFFLLYSGKPSPGSIKWLPPRNRPGGCVAGSGSQPLMGSLTNGQPELDFACWGEALGACGDTCVFPATS